MYANIFILTIITTMGLAAANATGLITSDLSAFAAQGQKFTAKLAGQNEVLPTNTRGTGSLKMELSPDGMISHYVLNVTNIGNVISAQIHEGANNTNGPVIFTFTKNEINGTNVNGTLSQGTVYSKLFEGPFAGKHLSDLIILINNGQAYVTINTKQHPLGEIRGQLSGVTSVTVPEFGTTTVNVLFAIVLLGAFVASTKYTNNKGFIKKL